MKHEGAFLAVSIFLLGPSSGFSQESGAHPGLYASGISFAGGVGGYSVRDEYISEETYSGTLPYVEVSWTRFREDRGFKLGLGFRAGGEVRNHTLSSTITGASLDLEYFYRAADFTILDRPATLYLGPSAGFTAYTSDQNIASNGLDLAISFAALMSIGGTSGIIIPVSQRFLFQSALRADLLSFGLRIVDLVESDESPVKVLTALNGTDATARIGFRYDLHRRLSVGVGYEAQVMRISSWDYLGIASDNLVFSLTFGI